MEIHSRDRWTEMNAGWHTMHWIDHIGHANINERKGS